MGPSFRWDDEHKVGSFGHEHGAPALDGLKSLGPRLRGDDVKS
jgi:hypothetical protein